jgi:hypothetical protein
MKQLDIALAARAHREGRGVRTASFRHRWLALDPLAVVLWQLGAEPFSAAAIGFGRCQNALHTVVAGDPRNRDLAFGTLVAFARWFNPLFEAPSADREAVVRGTMTFTRSRTIPQIVVANDATVELIGRLGRRLAYLRTDGPKGAPLDLVRLGQHLLFLGRHARVPGQQLIVSLTELMRAHWATPQSEIERHSLAALDAYVEPPSGTHGFAAAAQAERRTIGPAPSRDEDEVVEPLIAEFNKRRAGITEPAVVAPLLVRIDEHYHQLVKRTWDVLWRCFQREMAIREAPSVTRRLTEDREAYTQHIDWTAKDGRHRTRQTARQAAMLLRRLEEASALVAAEEACDDPIRMIQYVLDNKAVEGEVVRIDTDHKEMGRARRVRRPLVTIRTTEPCVLPIGKEFWWTAHSDGSSFLVHEVRPDGSNGSLVTLKLTTEYRAAPLPRTGDQACFSIHTTKTRWFADLPRTEPWTHRPRQPDAGPQPIEDVGA